MRSQGNPPPRRLPGGPNGVHRDHARKTSRNAATVLDLLIRLSGETDAAVGCVVGLTRAMIRFKKQSAGWYIDDAVVFAEAFDVPPMLFFMEQDEAHRWLVDNSRGLPALRPVPWAIDAATLPSTGSGDGR